MQAYFENFTVEGTPEEVTKFVHYYEADEVHYGVDHDEDYYEDEKMCCVRDDRCEFDSLSSEEQLTHFWASLHDRIEKLEEIVENTMSKNAKDSTQSSSSKIVDLKEFHDGSNCCEEKKFVIHFPEFSSTKLIDDDSVFNFVINISNTTKESAEEFAKNFKSILLKMQPVS